MECDICSSVISPRTAYFLTTTQVVTSEAYWKQVSATYHLHDPQSTAFRHFLFQAANQSHPWAICSVCAQLFEFDRDAARAYAELGQSPPNGGPVSEDRVREIAQRALDEGTHNPANRFAPRMVTGNTGSNSAARRPGAFSDLRPKRRLPRWALPSALALVVVTVAIAYAYVASTRADATVVNGVHFTGLVALTPDGRYAYSAGFYETAVVDTATNQVVARLPIRQGSDIAISPNGRRVYITSDVTSAVTVIDTATEEIAATIPLAGANEIELSPDGKLAYATFESDVPDERQSALALVDTTTDRVTATLSGFPGTRASVALSPNGHRAYVNTTFGLSVIDTDTFTIAAQRAIGSSGHLIVAADHVYDSGIGSAA